MARLAIDENGRRVRRSYFGRTQAEARGKMRAAQRRQEQGLPQPPERLTVEAFLGTWLEEKRATLRPESWRRLKTSHAFTSYLK